MDNLKNNLLNDEELEGVTGGADGQTNNGVRRECPECHKEATFTVYSGGRATCPLCGARVTI